MNYLEFFRRQRGWTQAQLAEKCGVNKCEISRMERGWLARPSRKVEKTLPVMFPGWTFEQLMAQVNQEAK